MFLSMLYAHVHVAIAADVCPPPGAALPATAGPTAALALWVGAIGAVEWAARRVGRAPVALPVVLAALLAAAAFALDAAGHAQAGLVPQRDAWSASVAALLGYGGLHAVLLQVLAAFALARALAGLLQPRHRVALDTLRVFVIASALQALLVMLMVRLLPRVLS